MNERGFTLVEIIVVLIILGLIMTFFGTKIIGAGDRAKADLTRIKIKDIATSLEQFQLRYNRLPSSLEGLTECNEETGPGCTPIANRDTLVDAWGNPFVYALEGNARAYRIKSLGADGQEGGDGVNFDIFGTGP